MPTFNAILQPTPAIFQPVDAAFAQPVGGIPPFDIDPTIGFLIEGTDGHDELLGSHLDDGIYGFGSNDTIFAGNGSDDVDGGSGDEWLYAGNGDDAVRGGFGNDYLVGGAGGDSLNGGADFDTASYYNAASGVLVDMTAGTGAGGDAMGDTFAFIERIVGSNFGDVLNGNTNGDDNFDAGAGHDLLFGHQGGDLLFGGLGDDTVDGGEVGAGYTRFENDTIVGGAGRDVLTGGLGRDTFVYANLDGADIITDFQNGGRFGTGDKIDISDFGFGTASFGANGIMARGTNPRSFSSDGDKFFFDTDDDILYQIGGGNERLSVVAEFTNGTNVVSTDFILT